MLLMRTKTKTCEHKMAHLKGEKDYLERSQASANAICEIHQNYDMAMHTYKLSLSKEYAYAYVTNLNNWALYHGRRGEFSEASQLLKKSYDIRKGFWLNHPTTMITLSNLAMTYTYSGLLYEAETTSLEAIHLMERIKSGDYLLLALHFHALASLYKYQNRHKDEEKVYHSVLIIYKSHYGAKDDIVIDMNVRLADCLTKQKKFLEAEQIYKDVLTEACQRENTCIETIHVPEVHEISKAPQADKLWFKIKKVSHPSVAKTIKKLLDLYSLRDAN
uniref:MalT-like TPR region domain-containing protein n=1 Tax=Glossina brevipalpis TaxID=37001 RepID=A0A1A9X4D8_9MUSC